MNNPNSLSAEQKQFCDNLLNLAEWLDSQDLAWTMFDYQNQVGYTGKICTNPEFKAALEDYYSHKNTNKERVLAVLLLRAAILAGDSFTSENV